MLIIGPMTQCATQVRQKSQTLDVGKAQTFRSPIRDIRLWCLQVNSGIYYIRTSQGSAVIHPLSDKFSKHAMSSWFGGDSSQAQAYDTWQNSDVTHHQPDTVHELIAGAASYEVSEDLRFI